VVGRRVGEQGEALAADFLENAGWTIVGRNFRVGHREVDLVARRGEVVAFVEVKTRSGRTFGHPLEAITPRKQREIAVVASAWIDRFGRADEAYRFDAVAIIVAAGSAPEIEHVEDAWGM
jgi:putative endonuclease